MLTINFENAVKNTPRYTDENIVVSKNWGKDLFLKAKKFQNQPQTTEHIILLKFVFQLIHQSQLMEKHIKMDPLLIII